MVTWIMTAVNAMTITVMAKVVTAIVTMTISLIFNFNTTSL
jgi:hypothetical protein